MDATDNLPYLNYISDKNDTFLLHSTDQALGVQDPTLNGQTFFGELDEGAQIWTIDSLPVLLNGSMRSEDQQEDAHFNIESSKVILSGFEENQSPDSCIENNEHFSYPIEIPGEAFVTSNGLFLTNEVLLQMNLPNLDEAQKSTVESSDNTEIFFEKDNNLYKVKSSKIPYNMDFQPDVDDSAQKIIDQDDLNGTEVIQLLNTDGTFINIDKSVLINNNNNDSNDENAAVNNRREDETVQISEYIERITAYKCKKCYYLSETLTDIMKHIASKVCEKKRKTIIETEKPKAKSVLNTSNIRNNKQKLVLLCSECNQGYCTTAELKTHMIMAHQLSSAENKSKEDKSKVNPKDQNRESKKQYLSIIKDQQKASRKVKCSIKGCDFRFALDEYRIRHEKCHVNGHKKQFKCPVCEKTFSIWRVCSLHLWKCHEVDVGLLSCVICNYKTVSPYKLWPHMLIHEDERQYLCSECGKSFKQLTQLRNHQVLHLANTEYAPNWISQQRCDTCGNIFSDTKSLKKHIQCVHNKFKPYVCNICGHKTARKAMLDLHLRQHTGEKPYQCQLCPYRTGDHNSLRRHIMRHSGGKKYSCPYCNYQSIQSIAYKHHIMLKHPGKEGIFRCTQCSFGTVNEHTYRTHVKTHENNTTNNENKEQEKCIQPETSTSSIETVRIIEIHRSNKTSKVEEDEETQHGFLTSINTDETVDTGGITIPAGLELQM